MMLIIYTLALDQNILIRWFVFRSRKSAPPFSGGHDDLAVVWIALHNCALVKMHRAYARSHAMTSSLKVVASHRLRVVRGSLPRPSVAIVSPEIALLPERSQTSASRRCTANTSQLSCLARRVCRANCRSKLLVQAHGVCQHLNRALASNESRAQRIYSTHNASHASS